MKILLVASENAPYASVGGLSQAIAFLAKALSKAGLDTRVFMPKYGVIDEKKYPMQVVASGLKVHAGEGGEAKRLQDLLICNVKFRDRDSVSVPTYFLENREYFELRANVYGYSDEHTRFYLLSLGCLEWLLESQRTGGWIPDIIHASDWHTGYLIEAIKTQERYKKALSKIKVLYTVHNFRHQGNFNFRYADFEDTGKKPLLSIFDPKMRLQNAMLRGVVYADWVNTVSSKHAEEVQTKEYGEGLDKYLRKYAYKLSGIANGIDTEEMNPETDKLIVSNYNLNCLEKRQKNKLDLQNYFKLPIALDVPVIGYIGRLAPQKGIDLILETLNHLEALPKCQFIFLGSGEENYYTGIKNMCEKYPTRVAAYLQRDFVIPRKIFSGADLLLVPSNFEPGGIVAMEALRYGCVPIVANTGGLSETVEEYNPATGTGNGFLHDRRDFWSFFVALIRALEFYRVPAIWKVVVKNSLAGDFSWDKTALHYINLYKNLLKNRK